MPALTRKSLVLFGYCSQGSKALRHFAQKLSRATAGNGLYIISGCLFLVLFWTSKKEQIKPLLTEVFLIWFFMSPLTLASRQRVNADVGGDANISTARHGKKIKLLAKKNRCRNKSGMTKAR